MKKEQRKLLPIGIGIFVLYLCIRYWDPLIATLLHSLSAGIPLVIGCALAYVLNILMSLYEKIYFPKSTKKLAIKTRRPICLTGAFLTLIAIITVVVWLILPQLISCVMLLVDEVPDAINNVIAWMEERHLLTEETLNQLKSIDWGSLLNGMSTWLTSGLGSVIDIVVSTVSAVVSGIITAFLAVVFAVYLLASKEKLAKQSERVMRRYLKPRLIDRIEYVLKILNNCFHRYIVGQCTEAVILGVLCLIGMLILGLPYAAMISALTAFTALIPFAGAYIVSRVGIAQLFEDVVDSLFL